MQVLSALHVTASMQPVESSLYNIHIVTCHLATELVYSSRAVWTAVPAGWYV